MSFPNLPFAPERPLCLTNSARISRLPCGDRSPVRNAREALSARSQPIRRERWHREASGFLAPFLFSQEALEGQLPEPRRAKPKAELLSLANEVSFLSSLFDCLNV